MAKYSGKIQKKRRTPTEKVHQSTTHTYHYESQKEDKGVLHKTKGYDKGLQSTKEEKRGRKKAGVHTKVSHTPTSKQKVRSGRKVRINRAKKGGK